jgi:hypothetical protein
MPQDGSNTVLAFLKESAHIMEGKWNPSSYAFFHAEE